VVVVVVAVPIALEEKDEDDFEFWITLRFLIAEDNEGKIEGDEIKKTF